MARKRAASRAIAPKTKKTVKTQRRSVPTVSPEVQEDSPPYPIKILVAVDGEEFPVVSQDNQFVLMSDSVRLLDFVPQP
jgi:hypothetical protein